MTEHLNECVPLNQIEVEIMAIDKNSLIKDLVDLVGEGNIIFEPEKLKKYGLDLFGNEKIPQLAIKPSSEIQFKRLNFLLRRHKISSITPRGFGLDVNLGAFSEDIIIDISSLNKKIEIDTQNSIVTVQAGVSCRDLLTILNQKGYCLPIEPIMNGSIGGFIATGGFGYGCFQYGYIINILRNCTIALPDGQIIQSGTSKFPPFNSGYNLNSLICGSEGFFGIITEIVLQIIPKSEHHLPILLSINQSDILSLLTELNRLSFIYNIIITKGIYESESTSTNVLITLRGSPDVIEQNQKDIHNIQKVEIIDSKKAQRFWENRMIEPSKLPISHEVIEFIIPINQISPFEAFLANNFSAYFGILLNPSFLLIYGFIKKDIDESYLRELNTDFFKLAKDLQIYPPTIGHRNKEFVKNFYPNLEILLKIKPIFDKFNIIKSGKLSF